MRGRHAVGCAGALVLLGGLAACGGSFHPASEATHSPAASRPANAQLTIAQARGVFAAFLPRFNQMRTDPALTDELTTGPETPSETFLKGSGGPPVGTLTGERFLVPRLTGYPRWFLAGGSAESTQGFLFFMTQQSAGASWREAAELFDVSLPAQILPDLSRSGFAGSGYVSTLPSADPALAIDPSALSAAYARYLNNGGHGAAAHSFVAGTSTTDYLRQDQQTAVGARALGWRFSDDHAPSTLPAYALQLPDGAGALVIFYTNETLSWTATSSSARVPRSATEFPNLPPLNFFNELGIKSARPGLRLTASSVNECLALVGPAGQEGSLVIVNDGKGTAFTKSG